MWSGLAAEAYDRAIPLGSSLGDVEFYRERLNGPTLEAMCGSGRLLIPLFDEGLDIEGFDSSADMISRGRAKAEQFGLSPRLEVADAATVDMGRTYGAVVVAVSSFMLLDRLTAQRALERFAAHLEPGGTLWLDMHTPPFLNVSAVKHLGDITIAGGPERAGDRESITTETISRGAEVVTVETRWTIWTRKSLRAALEKAGFTLAAIHDRPPFWVCEARRG